MSPCEEWRPVARDPRYEVSSHGRVRSWVKPGRSGNVREVPKVLAAAGRRGTRRGTFQGYITVWSGGTGEGKAGVPVHILVAEAFLGPRPEGQEIRHLDGNSLNNYASNLAYGTRSENILDAVRHGTWVQSHWKQRAQAVATRRANGNG